MKSIDLNQLPLLIEQNQITTKQGINLIAEFLSENYPVFGLQVYDEDFRSELVLVFLEKGSVIFTNYNPDIGDFFTYLYSYILSLANGLKKKNAKHKLQESLTENEIKKEFPLYSNKSDYTALSIRENQIPYKAAKFTPEDLKNGRFFPEDSKIEKTILTLAIKSSYYLNDTHINNISKAIGMDRNLLVDIIEYFNSTLEKKIEKRKKLESYRNKAYYFHRKYEKQIQMIKSELDTEFNSTQNYIYNSKLEKLERINQKQINNWERLNSKFQNGFGNIKPSNLSIAKLLGICERQVSYYLFCAKSGKTDLQELEKKLEELNKD